jgi:hypothetical protein
LNFAKARLIPIQRSVKRLKFSKGGKKGGRRRKYISSNIF